VIGLTRQAARPVSAKAAVQSPAATARRVRHAHTASVSSTTIAHSGLSGWPSLASTPCSDWFET
jgi:hypothetical protein